MRRSGAFWLLALCRATGLVLLPLLLSACAISSISNPFRSSEPEPLPPASSSPLAPLPATQPGARPAAADLDESTLHCPQVVAWPHDRLLTIYQGGKTGDSQAIIHRGEITKLVRECQIYADRISVKYGIAGRVLLGPKGVPGQVTLPIGIKVADAERKVLANDSTSVSTMVPADNPVGYFSVVKEISFPITMGQRPEDYKVFVAFKQAGAG